MGVKRVKMCPFLEKVNIFSRKIVDIHQEPFGSQWGYISEKNTLWTELGYLRGQNGGQKGKNVLFLEKVNAISRNIVDKH